MPKDAATEGLRQRIATTSESLDTPEDFSADDSGSVWVEEPERWAARNDRLRSSAKQRQHTNKEYIERKHREQDGTWLSLNDPARTSPADSVFEVSPYIPLLAPDTSGLSAGGGLRYALTHDRTAVLVGARRLTCQMLGAE